MGLVLVGVLLLQMAWIITMPPFRAIDEFDHAFRAAAVAGGEWVAGEAAEDGRGRLVTVPGSLVDAAHAQCADLEYTGPDNCSAVEQVDDSHVLVSSAAASYHPAYYWVVGTTARPFDGANALYAMRVASALLCLLFVAVSAWALSKLPSRWPLAALVLAMPPVFLYSTAMAAPNGPEMVAGLALWATLLALVHGQRPASESRLLWAAVGSALVLATLRVLGPVFVLLIVVSVAVFAPRQLVAIVRRHPRAVCAGTILTAATAIGQALWMYQAVEVAVNAEVSEGPRSFNPSSLILWPLQSIAAFPLRGDQGATVVYPIFLALVAIIVTLALRRTTRRLRWAIVVTLVASQLLPLVFTLTTLGSIGSIWQGRYGLPYSVGFVLFAGYALGLRHQRAIPARVVAPGVVLYGVGFAACLIKIRNGEASRSVSFDDPAWHTPPVALLVCLTAAACAMFYVALTSSRVTGPDADVTHLAHVAGTSGGHATRHSSKPGEPSMRRAGERSTGSWRNV